MDDYDWDVLSDAYDKAKAELATLRAENERLRVALGVFLYEELDEGADFGEWFESACKYAKEALK